MAQGACVAWIQDWVKLDNTDVLDLEGHDNRFGWHAYEWYDEGKIHKGFYNHIIRRSLSKMWERYKDWWLSPIEATSIGK